MPKLTLLPVLFLIMTRSFARTVTQPDFNFQQVPFTPQLLPSVNTGLYERDFALSPDGTEIFFTLQSPAGVFQTILHSKKNPQGKWSTPEVAAFAGHYSDLEPAFTSDGKKLFFVSNRPVNGGQKKDFDIWYTLKENGKWSEAKRVEGPVNTEADEFYPSVAGNGNLYYTATYKNGIGREDIFVAKWENGKYLDPLPLDTSVNSKTFEFNAFVSPDEQFILFTSYGRKDDKGRGDLYISIKDAQGNWQQAKNIATLNSDRLDYCPFVSFDKKILFFTSERHNLKANFPSNAADYNELNKAFNSPLNGNGNIYWVSFEKVLQSLK